jgi:hypothetical protein
VGFTIGVGFSTGVGFAIGVGLTTLSSDEHEELVLLHMRLLCRSGLEGGRGRSGGGNAPGTFKGGSDPRGGSGDGSGGSMRSYCMVKEAMDAARVARVV